MPFTQPTSSAPRPPLRLQRKNLADLLSLRPDGADGLTAQVFWFEDVLDQDPANDRVVVGFYDMETACSYLGVAVLNAEDPAAFKKQLRSVWNGDEVYVGIFPAVDASNGGLPTISPAEKPAEASGDAQ